MRALVLALVFGCTPSVSLNAADAGTRCDDVTACACALDPADVILLVNVWDWTPADALAIEDAIPGDARSFPLVRFGYMNAKQNSPPAVQGPMQALGSYAVFIHNVDLLVENVADSGGISPDLDLEQFGEVMGLRVGVRHLFTGGATGFGESDLKKALTATCSR